MPQALVITEAPCLSANTGAFNAPCLRAGRVPAPAHRDADHRIGEGTEIVGHVLNGEHPFHVARVFQTVDLMTKGRAAWNCVTSVNDNEARNMGRGDEHLERVGETERHLRIRVGLRQELHDPRGPLLDGALAGRPAGSRRRP